MKLSKVQRVAAARKPALSLKQRSEEPPAGNLADILSVSKHVPEVTARQTYRVDDNNVICSSLRL